jgi:SSS family solute:Na+ symporter
MSVPLGNLDILVLIGAVLASILIGLRFRGKNDSIESYLLGDRNLPWWAILGSIVATETSTATVLSVPGDGYGPVGFRFLQLVLGFVLGRILVVYFLLPKYFEGKLMSAYEVLGNRFGGVTKCAASTLFLVTRNLGDGLRLFLAAMVLEKLVGWPLAWSAVAMGGTTILYTYFGGMRSVVWNDCVQFVIYMIGAIAAVFVIVSYLPEGWKSFYEYAVANSKFTMLDFQFSFSNSNTLWTGLIGGAALSLGSHGTDQMMVQRYLSARSQKDASIAIFWSGIVVFGQFTLFLLIGMLLACFYSFQETPPTVRPDEIFAHFMVHSFPKNTGLIGLMLAAILAAAMSTLSSSLSASASAVMSDLWLPSFRVPPSEAIQVWTTRLLTLGFGILQIAIGIWASTFTNSVITNALTIAGFSSGILLGLFGLGVFTKSVGSIAALWGAVCGLLVMLLLKFGLHFFGHSLAFPWLPVCGSITTFAIGLLVSKFSVLIETGSEKFHESSL